MATIDFNQVIEYGIEINPAKGFDTYDITFFVSPDQRVMWEQDHPHCWRDDFYSGIFYTFRSPEFASLTQGIDLGLPTNLKFMYVAQFVGRGDSKGLRLGVHNKSGPEPLIQWAGQHGCPSLQPKLPKSPFCNLAFDYLDGEYSKFCLELIDIKPRFPHYEQAREVAEKAIHEKFGKNAEVSFNHAKVVVGDNDLSNAKLYFKHTIR